MKKIILALILIPALTSAQFISKNTGDWNIGSTWTLGLPPPLTGGVKLADDVTIAAPTEVTLNSSLEVQSGAKLTVEGLLIITGNITFKNGSSIMVEAGGVLHVLSSGVNANNSTDVTINGELIIDNDFEAGAGSTILGIGSVEIGGTSSGTGTIFGQATGCSACSFSDGGLPIELISFDANVDGDLVYLTWVVASQLNNNYFTVYKSHDASNWWELSTIDGAGTNNEVIKYQYTDNNPTLGVAYYKLRQTDYDGNWEEFNLVPIQINDKSPPKIVKIINVTGSILNDYSKGINIIIFEDGTIKKIIK